MKNIKNFGILLILAGLAEASSLLGIRPVDIKINTKFAWGLSSRQGVRPTMEDAHVICNPVKTKNSNLLVGIFDGHGGKTVADYVSEKFEDYFSINKFIARYKIGKKELKFSNKTERALYKTFSDIEEDLKEKTYAKNMGSTAVVCYIKTFKSGHKSLTAAWLADSRTVLVDKKHKVVWASKDHKPDNPEEKARIEKNGGEIVFYGVPRVSIPGVDTWLAVSRSFGDFLFKQQNSQGEIFDGGAVSGKPEIHTIKLMDDHKFLILACDGVWDVISNEKAAEIVAHEFNKKDYEINVNSKKDLTSETSETSGNSQNALSAACALRDAAFNAGSTDNISVIVVNL